MAELLTREQFRERVFARDEGECVRCHNPAVDVHHIYDRSLWDDGGYYLENGVSLCDSCHMFAERTLFSCEELKSDSGIGGRFRPPHFYTDEDYDHWGNIILPGGSIIKGELWGPKLQELFRKAGILHHVLPYVKYPRTYHLPWSPNLQNDDRLHEDVNCFIGKTIVMTVKMDGENTTMYADKIHARSLDSKSHESRTWVKALHGRIAHDIPAGWRISGENVYAKHSIHYHNLDRYFYVFSIWDENNMCLSWEDTKEYAALLGLKTVPEVSIFKVADPVSFESRLATWWNITQRQSPDPVEGYVVRNVQGFSYKDFRREVAKYVRKNHVQTSAFWMTEPVVPNQLLK